jgi:hypothetical protein
VNKKERKVLSGPPIDPFVRNAEFAVVDNALDPALRKSLAAALRVAHQNERVAAEQRELDAERERDAAREEVAPLRTGGKAGRRSDKVKAHHAHIRELMVEFPTWPRERLYEKSNKKISKARFDGHVRTVVTENASK